MELPSPFIFTLESLSRKRVLMKYYFCEFQAPTRTENCKWSHLFLVTDNFYNRAEIRVNFFNTYRRSMIIDRLLRDNDKWTLSSMPIDRFVQNVCSILFIRLKVGHGRCPLCLKLHLWNLIFSIKNLTIRIHYRESWKECQRLCYDRVRACYKFYGLLKMKYRTNYTAKKGRNNFSLPKNIIHTEW